jgi:putative hydrolase of the HAD superfamily
MTDWATPIRAVLFDLTATLIEPAERVGSIYGQIALQHGVSLPAWRLDDAFRRVLRHCPARVFPGATPAKTAGLERAWWREVVWQTFQATDSSVRFAEFDAFFAEVYSYYARGDAWRLMPRARETLHAIRETGRATGVVSNFDHRILDLLEELEITALFDVIIYPQRCGFAKPDRAIFEAALDALKVEASWALYVGHDRETDLKAAEAAGLRACDVNDLGGLWSLTGHLATL